MVLRTPDTTFLDLRKALDPDRNQGTAMAHALICRGRVDLDLDRHLHGGSWVRLLPEPAFTSLIRF